MLEQDGIPLLDLKTIREEWLGLYDVDPEFEEVAAEAWDNWEEQPDA